MPHPKRKYENGATFAFCARLAEGLPFVPNKYIRDILYGAAARAISRHPDVIVSALEFMTNHYHGIATIVGDPAQFADFLHDLNDEIARVVNKLKGRKNYKVWGQRTFVARIGDSEALIKQLAYAYVNPVAANFVDKASKWTGAGTWRFLFKKEPEYYKWIRSSKLKKLPNKSFSKKEIKNLCRMLDKMEAEEFELKIKPFAWKHFFYDTRNLTDKEILSRILQEVKRLEDEYRAIRKRENKALCDLNQLALQNIYKPYRPNSYGRRVYCICSDPELRRQLLEEYKEFCAECEAAWEAWKQGDFSVFYPPGAFLPPQHPISCSVPLGP